MLQWGSKERVNVKNPQYQSRPHLLLQYNPSSLGDQNIVTPTMHNDTADTVLDHAWKHSERRRQTSISIGEDVNVGALEPGLVERSMYGFLHVLTVEIDRGLCGLTEKAVSSTSVLEGNRKILRETQDIP
jgi:hypothetical protein